jgi:hypothetical protein
MVVIAMGEYSGRHLDARQWREEVGIPAGESREDRVVRGAGTGHD